MELTDYLLMGMPFVLGIAYLVYSMRWVSRRIDTLLGGWLRENVYTLVVRQSANAPGTGHVRYSRDTRQRWLVTVEDAEGTRSKHLVVMGTKDRGLKADHVESEPAPPSPAPRV